MCLLFPFVFFSVLRTGCPRSHGRENAHEVRVAFFAVTYVSQGGGQVGEYLHLLHSVCGMMPSTFRFTVVQQALHELAGGIGGGKGCGIASLSTVSFFPRQYERVGKGWGAYGGPTFALPGLPGVDGIGFCVVRP